MQHEQSCTFHRSIRHTYDIKGGQDRPSQAELTECLGIYRETEDIPGIWLNRDRMDFPSQGRLHKLFSGSLQEDEQICLHAGAPSRPQLQYSMKDVDSFIAIFSNLNSFREPICLPIVPQPSSILERSIHLSYPIIVEGKREDVPLHKIPHMLFATTGTRSHPIYAFFPAMYRPKCVVHLPDRAYAAFYDRLLRPGLAQLSYRAESTLHAQASAAALQHIPPTFNEAILAARASSERSGKGDGTRGRPINITLDPSKDPQVWNTFQRLLDTIDEYDAPGSPEETDAFDLANFRGLFFAYDSKGLKLETQKQRVFSTCIENFSKEDVGFLDEVLTLEHDNRHYIDIASEVLAVYDLRFPQGSTLLAKKCCVYNTMRFILNGDLDSQEEGPGYSDQEGTTRAEGETQPDCFPKATVTEYPICLLRDTITLTAELRQSHPHAYDGLIYAQTYSPFKELFDAKKIFPFSHPGIINLGYSTLDNDTLRALQKGPENRTAAKAADIRSRKRIRLAMANDQTQQWGWRTEFRVTRQLAKVMQYEDTNWASFLADFHRGSQLQTTARATAFYPTDPVAVNVNEVSFAADAFFIHRTEYFKDFVHGNIHKHLVAIDSIRALYSKQSTPVAAAQLHAVLVLALRYFLGSLPPSESWKLSREPSGSADVERRPGLGLSYSREQHGFGFLPASSVDWSTFTLSQRYQASISLPDFQHAARLRPAQGFYEIRDFLDKLLRMVDASTPEPLCEFVMEKCVHLILQNYRENALVKMLGESGARQIHHIPQTTGDIFAFDGLRKVAGKVNRVVKVCTGNKTFFKTAPLFFRWTWGSMEIGFKRNFITKLPFRTLFSTAMDYLRVAGNAYATPARLETILAYRFFEQHSALPYPDSNGSLQQVSKTHERVLICFEPLDAAEHVPRGISLESFLKPVRFSDGTHFLSIKPAGVPGCLDRIENIEEARAWVNHRRNLVRYIE